MIETLENGGSAFTTIALRAAVSHATRTRREIADSVGVSDRTLRRWLRGEIHPDTEQWERMIRTCGISPGPCFLMAVSGRDDLIGSSSYSYIDKFIEQFFTRLAGLEDEGCMPLDPRAAARDAGILSSSWTEAYRRRREFMDQEYLKTGLPPFRGV